LGIGWNVPIIKMGIPEDIRTWLRIIECCVKALKMPE